MKFHSDLPIPAKDMAANLNRFFPKEESQCEECQGECCREVDDGDPNESRIPTPER